LAETANRQCGLTAGLFNTFQKNAQPRLHPERELNGSGRVSWPARIRFWSTIPAESYPVEEGFTVAGSAVAASETAAEAGSSSSVTSDVCITGYLGREGPSSNARRFPSSFTTAPRRRQRFNCTFGGVDSPREMIVQLAAGGRATCREELEHDEPTPNWIRLH